MLTRQQQAQQLRAMLVPFIECNGIEQQIECRDGNMRRCRQARLGGFLLHYETPFHRNPMPITSCWDQAIYLQLNPVEDYALVVKFLDKPDDPEKSKRTTMFCACWSDACEPMHINTFASNESRWYDILFVVVELAAKTAREPARAVVSDGDTPSSSILPEMREN